MTMVSTRPGEAPLGAHESVALPSRASLATKVNLASAVTRPGPMTANADVIEPTPGRTTPNPALTLRSRWPGRWYVRGRRTCCGRCGRQRCDLDLGGRSCAADGASGRFPQGCLLPGGVGGREAGRGAVLQCGHRVSYKVRRSDQEPARKWPRFGAGAEALAAGRDRLLARQDARATRNERLHPLLPKSR
jgi:hypothetical protein